MSEHDVTQPDDDEVGRRDPNDPGEVPTRFTTVGKGWSGRDDDEDEDEKP